MLLSGAVVFGAAVAVLAALATYCAHLSATYTARVKLAHAKVGATMLAKNQSKTKMTRQMSMSETICVSTMSQKVASTFALSSAISIKRSSRSSYMGMPCAIASLDLSCRPMTNITLLRSESIGMMR
jgi:hypothetical protein